jgi:hypothetical protein
VTWQRLPVRQVLLWVRLTEVSEWNQRLLLQQQARQLRASRRLQLMGLES